MLGFRGEVEAKDVWLLDFDKNAIEEGLDGRRWTGSNLEIGHKRDIFTQIRGQASQGAQHGRATFFMAVLLFKDHELVRESVWVEVSGAASLFKHDPFANFIRTTNS